MIANLEREQIHMGDVTRNAIVGLDEWGKSEFR